jgi:hypothetical protein
MASTAGLLDVADVGVQPACACSMSVSSRAMSKWWRAASAIQPRASASWARARASTRLAVRTASVLALEWKLGQCPQILA